MPTVVIKPSTGRLVGLVALSLLLTLGSIFMMREGGLLLLVGLIGLALFGGGAVMLLVRHARGGVTLTLTPAGLLPGSGGFVPWHDVGGFGATKTGGAACLGAWLTDPRSYLASLTPQQQSLVLKAALAAKGIAPILGAADPGSLRDAVTLASMPAHDVGAALRWAKAQAGGYDLTFPALNLDRPIPQLVQLCEQYRSAATAALAQQWQPPPVPPSAFPPPTG
ncbi:hypothetical protein [Pseudactinotalea suaedae]|uniref:hypothetical protein n=1 Tax=Pseudactinotalea suaedae TaxID=1524924 RepID=UPI0012E144D1|nr:hypothetical protein [Pseudactinotalea suaedae]